MDVYEKSITNIILHDEKLKARPLRKQARMSTLTTSISILLGILTSAIRQEKVLKASRLERK